MGSLEYVKLYNRAVSGRARIAATGRFGPATLDIIESVSKGFELQLAGDITDQWSVSASYSYIDGEQVDRFGDTGNRPTELPENLFAVWSHHMLSPRMGFGLGLTYQDASYINNSNTALLPSFTRIDAAFHYDLSDDTRIQINIENAADKLYFPTLTVRIKQQWARHSMLACQSLRVCKYRCQSSSNRAPVT